MLTRLLNAPFRIQAMIAWSAALVLAIVLAWATFGLASALMGVRSRLLETRALAGRLSQVASTKRDAATRGLAPEDGGNGLFLEASSLTLARADLQQRINTVVGSQGTTIASAGNLPDIVEKQTQMIGIRADFSGPYDSVAKAIAALESSVPPLIIRALDIHAAGISAPNRAPELAAQLRVYTAVRVTDGATSTDGTSR